MGKYGLLSGSQSIRIKFVSETPLIGRDSLFSVVIMDGLARLCCDIFAKHI